MKPIYTINQSEFCKEAVTAAEYLTNMNIQSIKNPSKLTKEAIKQKEKGIIEIIQDHIDKNGLGFALFSILGDITIKSDNLSMNELLSVNEQKGMEFGCIAMYIGDGLVQANAGSELTTVYDAKATSLQIYPGDHQCEA